MYFAGTPLHPEEARWERVNFADLDAPSSGELFAACLSSPIDEIKRLIDEDPTRLKEKNAAGTTPLMVATMENRIDVVELLLDYGMDIKETTTSGLAALTQAISFGWIELIEKLIDRGAPAVEGYGSKSSPIEIASLAGRIDVAKILIKRGAKLFTGETKTEPVLCSVDMDRVEYLKWALSEAPSPDYLEQHPDLKKELIIESIRSGAIDCLKWLMSREQEEEEREDEINESGENKGETNDKLTRIPRKRRERIDLQRLKWNNGGMVHTAALYGAFDVMQWLVDECGLTAHGPDGTGSADSPIFYAVAHGKEACFRFLLSRVGPSALRYTASETNDTLLITATLNGQPKFVRILLDLGVDPNSSAKTGTTALMCAARSGDMDVIKLLLERGADINVETPSGLNALLSAIMYEKQEAAHFFYDHPAYLTRRSTFKVEGRNLFHLSAKAGFVDLCRKIAVDHPSLIRLSDHTGRTALDLALGTGKLEVVEYLVSELGYDPKNDISHYAMTYAALEGHLDAIKWMVKHGRPIEWDEPKISENKDAPSLPLVEASYKNHKKVVKYLLQMGANPNHPNTNSAPIHYAADHGNIKVLKLLCEHGATIDSANNEGRTVLHRAAASGQEELVKFLLSDFKDKGLDVNVFSTKKNTPLIEAALSGHASVMKLLDEAGADWKIGYEPVIISATRADSVEAVKMCLDRGLTVGQEDSFGYSAVDYAVYFGQLKVLDFILSEVEPERCKIPETCTKMLEMAMRDNEMRSLEILLAKFRIWENIDPNAKFTSASSMRNHLVNVCNNANLAKVSTWMIIIGLPTYFPTCKFDLDAVFVNALQNNNLSLVKSLLKMGKPFTSTSYVDVMHIACRSGSLPLVQWLLRKTNYNIFAVDLQQTRAFSAAPAGSEVEKWLKEIIGTTTMDELRS